MKINKKAQNQCSNTQVQTSKSGVDTAGHSGKMSRVKFRKNSVNLFITIFSMYEIIKTFSVNLPKIFDNNAMAQNSIT